MNRILSLKPGGKIAREAHSLDLVSIKSPDPKEVLFLAPLTKFQIELKFRNFSILASGDSIDELINSIRRAYEFHFSAMPEKERFKLDVQPPSRLCEILPPDRNESPCGGFVGTYRSLCDYYHVTPSEQLCWDLENIYNDSDIFDMTKFTEECEVPVSGDELLPILHALRYNTFFQGVILQHVKFEKKEVCQLLSDLLKNKPTFSHICLSGITPGSRDWLGVVLEGLLAGLTSSGNSGSSIRMTDTLATNLEYFDLSNTLFEDKPLFNYLVPFLKIIPSRIKTLNLANIGASAKALGAILSGLAENIHLGYSSIEFISLENNRLGLEGSTALFQLLQKEPYASNITTLKLKSSGVFSKLLFDALSNGNTKSITNLDVSGVKISKPEEVKALSDLLSKNMTLKWLDLSSTNIPSDALESILLSFNPNLFLHLNMAFNPQLAMSGAKILGKIAYKISNISILDLSDCEFGDDACAEILQGLRSNFHLHTFYFNRNFIKSGTVPVGKSKYRPLAVENLVKLISSDCTIQSKRGLFLD